MKLKRPNKVIQLGKFILAPFKSCGLYYADILSDLLQTVSLYNNCHYDFFHISLTIITSSYLITVVYIKNRTNQTWTTCFFYPWSFEYVLSFHDVKCFSALIKHLLQVSSSESCKQKLESPCWWRGNTRRTNKDWKFQEACLILWGYYWIYFTVQSVVYDSSNVWG